MICPNRYFSIVQRAGVRVAVAIAILLSAKFSVRAQSIATEQAVEWQQASAALEVSAKQSCVGLLADDGRWSSGVVVGSQGHWIFTVAHGCSHVGESILVYFGEGRMGRARVVRRDARLDAAVLKIDPQKIGTREIRSDTRGVAAAVRWSASPGDESAGVVAMWSAGHAGGAGAIGQAGVRMGFGYQREDSALLVSTCALAPGDSGGPVFDRRGRLLGLHRTVEAGGDFATHVSLAAILDRWPDLVAMSGLRVDDADMTAEFIADPRGGAENKVMTLRERMVKAGDDNSGGAIARQLNEHQLARQARRWHALQAAAEGSKLFVNTQKCPEPCGTGHLGLSVFLIGFPGAPMFYIAPPELAAAVAASSSITGAAGGAVIGSGAGSGAGAGLAAGSL